MLYREATGLFWIQAGLGLNLLVLHVNYMDVGEFFDVFKPQFPLVK